MKTIILLGRAGYQIIITILARTRLVGYLSYPARPRCTQICVYPRAFMTLRVAQFSLKIAYLSFSMGPRGPRTYGLRPRLYGSWLNIFFLRSYGLMPRAQTPNCGFLVTIILTLCWILLSHYYAQNYAGKDGHS